MFRDLTLTSEIDSFGYAYNILYFILSFKGGSDPAVTRECEV